jgi:hypothetical protein
MMIARWDSTLLKGRVGGLSVNRLARFQDEISSFSEHCRSENSLRPDTVGETERAI